MKISVVGTGYVGLVAGVCFADTGHRVICVDRDSSKIDLLKEGKIPIYEPGLEDILEPARRSERISFTTELKSAVEETDVVFIAVGTPEKEDGQADLGPTFTVATQIAECANADKIVVLKSTVPVGTWREVQKIFDEKSKYNIEVVNNPEFLKEGAAIDDFLRPDRVVIGCRSERAEKLMREIYSPFVKNGHPIYFMDNTSAELCKYAANAFLSVKISFVNELARLADKVGADINNVRKGFTSDSRINPAFFYPGVGYGGSCFPKDVVALIHTGNKHGIPMNIVKAADEVNDKQKLLLFEMIQNHFGDLNGKRIALWGLSFKPRTDDIREAPALYIARELKKAGASVIGYDPVATENFKQACDVEIEYGNNPVAISKDADAVALVTEWNEFRNPDFPSVKEALKTPILFDGRNIYDPQKMKSLGFTYYCIGRQGVLT